MAQPKTAAAVGSTKHSRSRRTAHGPQRAPHTDAAHGAPTGSAHTGGGASIDRFDDENYPAYSPGRAAEMLSVTPAFLRALNAAQLIEPQRSDGGHRRYSRSQLRLAARARELVDGGTTLEAACRIVMLEDQLAQALRTNAVVAAD